MRAVRKLDVTALLRNNTFKASGHFPNESRLSKVKMWISVASHSLEVEYDLM